MGSHYVAVDIVINKIKSCPHHADFLDRSVFECHPGDSQASASQLTLFFPTASLMTSAPDAKNSFLSESPSTGVFPLCPSPSGLSEKPS